MSISSSEQSIYDQEYYTYHLELLAAFSAQIPQLPPFNTDFPTEDDLEFLAALTQLVCKLDDQNAIFGHQANEQDDAYL